MNNQLNDDDIQAVAEATAHEALNDGGPAFPATPVFTDTHGWLHPSQVVTDAAGMTLRDWFAGQALQGMFANSAMIDTFSAHGTMAQESFIVADAMIEARNRKEQS